MIKKSTLFIYILGLIILPGCYQSMENADDKITESTFTGAPGEVKIITLNPGHFHAALVQKYQYEQVDSVVHIYAPEGPELDGHLKRIDSYNSRTLEPTNWNSKIHASPDYLGQLIEEKPGNLVVISGNNAQKTSYIGACIKAGLNVLADKPMAIKPSDFKKLKPIFTMAQEKGVLLYDLMTERYEITTMMQKALSQIPELFGELEKGSVENPAITKESVHHFSKNVSGKPLIRPAWFFDVEQQGEGMVDVSTHLVDLVFWECFPEKIINYEQDIEIKTTRRWPTKLSLEQFNKVTGFSEFPEFLHKDIQDETLHTYSNGEINFVVNGVHAKVSVAWDYQAPQGASDTHYSIMRGTKANLVIRQGADQNYKPMLFVEPVNKQTNAIEKVFPDIIEKLAIQYPGLSFKRSGNGWQILIPEEYKVGHEAHFAEVTQNYLKYLIDGELPEWEVPNMLAKYYVTTKAIELSHQEIQ